jgi:hypothetical protein
MKLVEAPKQTNHKPQQVVWHLLIDKMTHQPIRGNIQEQRVYFEQHEGNSSSYLE